jgi:hypothetical protein
VILDHSAVVDFMQDIAMVGAGIGVVGAGIMKVYKMARNVEKIFEYTVENRAENEAIKQALVTHTNEQTHRDSQRDMILQEVKDNVQEITREIRPNGGSSIKDTVTRIGMTVETNSRRIDHIENRLFPHGAE